MVRDGEARRALTMDRPRRRHIGSLPCHAELARRGEGGGKGRGQKQWKGKEAGMMGCKGGAESKKRRVASGGREVGRIEGSAPRLLPPPPYPSVSVSDFE